MSPNLITYRVHLNTYVYGVSFLSVFFADRHTHTPTHTDRVTQTQTVKIIPAAYSIASAQVICQAPAWHT